MDNKKLGIILIIIGLLIAGSIFVAKSKDDKIIKMVIEQQGSCFLADGTCLHEDRNIYFYLVAGILSAANIALGVYTLFFNKTQTEIISTIKEHKDEKKSEEKFDILLKGLNKDEKTIIKAVKEQDGITQHTLRLRTDLHKSRLSIALTELEKKGLIARKEKGKTKQVFLKTNL